MNCCCQNDASDTVFDYENMLLYNRPTHQETPQLKIKLDLPNDSGYLATYWPSQKITGQLTIHLKQKPIKINHLHIVLFGHVQVYGDSPGRPFSSGLFDHVRNEQLTHTGVRVMPSMQHEHLLDTGPLYPVTNGKIKKSSHDRYLEKLVKQMAGNITDNSSGHHVLYHASSQCQNHEAAFELTQSSYTVNFSIRVPSRAIHSFEHPHTPIVYRVIAFMHLQDMVCYTSQKIKVESFQRPPVMPDANTTRQASYYYAKQPHSSFLFNALLFFWKKQSTIQNTLRAYVSSSHSCVEPGGFIPFTVTIEGMSSGTFQAHIRIELIQRLVLVCSLNEDIEYRVMEVQEQETTMNEDVTLPARIQVPKDCVCSIDATSTRDIVSLVYEIVVHLTIRQDARGIYTGKFEVPVMITKSVR